MRRPLLAAVAALALALPATTSLADGAKTPAPAAAKAALWEIDSAHTSAQFAVRHLMVSTVRGSFSKVSGTLEYDGKDLATLKADVTIDVASVNTGIEKRDEHLRSADFFDVAKFPTMTFKSKKAEKAGEGKFKLTGDLTIHGVTKEVTLEVEGPAPVVKDPWGNTKTGATATVKINRTDFGLKWNAVLEAGGVAVGEEVSITIDIEAYQKK